MARVVLGRRRHSLEALPRVRRECGAYGARRDSVRLGEAGEARREALPVWARREAGARQARGRRGARRTAREAGARRESVPRYARGAPPLKLARGGAPCSA